VRDVASDEDIVEVRSKLVRSQVRTATSEKEIIEAAATIGTWRCSATR